jgi:septum site-determining protein MinC
MMTLLRGKGRGLELVFSGREFEEALAELQAKMNERSGFYTGTAATVLLGAAPCTGEQISRLRVVLEESGVRLEAVSGNHHLEPVAAAAGLRFVPAIDDGGELARRRALRPKREVQISDAARSLVADFAGARSDIAQRRSRGEESVRRVFPHAASVAKPPIPDGDGAAASGTLYHVGTLRGGQTLQQIGNIVVIGDVNPGAELVASGDVVVFGALRGVAHAGAQGDASARVYALLLAPTQLRIATLIAADAGDRQRITIDPETAYVHDDRIAIVPLDRSDAFPRGGAPN